jgi:hypothetical protein
MRLLNRLKIDIEIDAEGITTFSINDRMVTNEGVAWREPLEGDGPVQLIFQAVQPNGESTILVESISIEER